MCYDFSYFKVLGIGTCTCRYFPAEYLVFEVSVKSGIGAALVDSYICNCIVVHLPYSALSSYMNHLRNDSPPIVCLVVDHLLPMQERRPIAINSVPSYLDWLQNWNKHMEEAITTVLFPLHACQIHTPLVVRNWSRAL